MVDFRAIIDNLKDMHFYDVILPFLLVYVIVFAILEKSKIFSVKEGDNEKSHVKSVNSVISLVFGLFVVASLQTVIYLENLIVNISVFLVFILVVLIALGFIFGEDYMNHFLYKDKDKTQLRTGLVWAIAAVVLIVSIFALVYATGMEDSITDFFDDLGDFDSDSFWTFVIVIAIGAVLYWISKDSGSSHPVEKDKA
ncbi:MAG: hypothetical protein PF569_05310 [Candidatus Woesearchaeota archaeon]|jgi:UDP-N-acetylmuramyl pentapeptide phosphotransferase/UDP-N-acetylglucosamine-1-phosphate transferase|nr:hypothetical protein [Candidatus Woesearchaeota archaeon]